jgi:hypothetical protein
VLYHSKPSYREKRLNPEEGIINKTIQEYFLQRKEMSFQIERACGWGVVENGLPSRYITVTFQGAWCQGKMSNLPGKMNRNGKRRVFTFTLSIFAHFFN